MPTPAAPYLPRFSTLVALWEQSQARYATRPLFGVKAHGAWSFGSYGDFGLEVARARAGLQALGIGPGDRVALISNNSVAWAAMAYAALGRGASIVPMYEQQQPKEWAFILKDSGAKLVLVARQALVDTLAPFRADLPELQHVRCVETDWPAFLAQPHPAAPPLDVAPSSTAVTIYTSGTTGQPKGVVLSHANVATNVSASLELFPLRPEDRSLSFLPWAHAFGQTAELHTLIAGGASMALAESIPKLIDNLAEVRPTTLLAVPNVFNRIYDGVQKQLATRPKAIQALVKLAVAGKVKLGRGEAPRRRERLAIAVAEKLVFKKVVARFGGRLRYAVSGGAALSREVAEFIDAIGIMVFEGYGLTETSPVATANTPTARRIGSAGKPIPGVTVTLDRSVGPAPDEGEVIIHGHNVMQGYWKRDDETAKVMTADGGFRTGDLGRFDADGFLFITGRIKEQYKLENGRYVAPAGLEAALQLSPLIAQAMVHGANKPFNVALVVVDAASLAAWGQAHALGSVPLPELVKQQAVRDAYRAEIDAMLGGAKGYEHIKQFHLLTEEFSVDNDLLTPKLSMKRRNIVAKYQSELDAMYR
jgi:long-chain acyl-CoA synthetase